MRISFAFIIAFAALAFASETAWAKLVKVAWISESDLKSKCDSNGGTWSSGQTGYSCGKKCDGGKDYCVVGCSKGKEHNECHASLPMKAPTSGRMTVEGVLNYSSRPPSAGPLEGSPGATPGGPSGVGTPKPTTPPAGKLY